ncbi:MAG: sigma-54 dependent transcriptional regulator [Bdellovibrionota bacterium]
MESILVVEDTDSLRDVLCTVLSAEGYKVAGAATAEEGLGIFKTDQFSLVLSDLKLPNKSGLDFLKESRVINNSVPVVVMTAYGDIDIAVTAMKLGATDFITKPFDPSTLCTVIGQIIEHRRVVDRNLLGVRKRSQRRLVTQSPQFEAVLKQAAKVAPLTTPVLVLGESGTGKDLIARYIHENSSCAANPFVAVNCASTPGELLESEFFGHEAGSFTGATERRLGLFEVAHNGTIFLDEIGNMPMELQVKLLRVLQESEIKRIGSNSVQKVNTRVISATNCDIENEIKRGNFRSDLYYRLSVVVLEVPPLRERTGDISLLANYFVKCFAADMNMPTPQLSPQAIRMLENYSWPGNVRELENVIERAMIFSDGELNADSFQLGAAAPMPAGNEEQNLPDIAAIAVREAEIAAILRVMSQTSGNKSKAAKILGVSYKTLLNKFKEYQLDSRLGQPGE